MHFTLLMVLAMVIWGIGWGMLKIVTESVGMEVASFWRFVIMMISFVPILIWWGKPLHVSPRVLLIVGVSAVMNVAFMYGSYWGVKLGTAGAGGVMITTISPALTVLLSLWWFKVKVSRSMWIGLIVGLLGGVVMLELWHRHIFDAGNAFFIFSALVWAVLTLLSQHSQRHLSPIHFSFLLSIFGTLFTLPLALPYEITAVFEQDARFWMALLFLSVLGQSVASTIYFVASGKLGSGAASSYMFVVPLSALAAGYALLDEIPSIWLVAGGAISTLAIYIINSRRFNSLSTR
ncbi:MAG: DMT family transporter [Campylobacterales bacterium]|nr:DMT family transporter [Campylobacterales bacterium]